MRNYWSIFFINPEHHTVSSPVEVRYATRNLIVKPQRARFFYLTTL